VSRPAPQRLIDFLTLASEHLAAKGIDGARLDAELLLAHALGLTRVELYTSYDRPLAKEEVDRFRELLRRRAAREPVAYIIGSREFWSLDLHVDRRVLIPRPETETLVEAALKILGATGRRAKRGGASQDASAPAPSEDPAGAEATPGASAPRVLDLGTGSGAIAIALAVELSNARIVATDVTAAALEVAPRNAAKHGVADRIEFRQGDLYAAVRDGERFDLIVSNPPYVRARELKRLAPEVRDWEPAGALVSGTDGMDATRGIVARAAEFLTSGGWVLLEVGTQAAGVRELLDAAHWRDVRTFADLAGHPRVIGGRASLRAADAEAAESAAREPAQGQPDASGPTDALGSDALVQTSRDRLRLAPRDDERPT
jgi:release factor glutamine methyltransferase